MRLIDADAVKKQAITLVTGTRTWEVVTVSDIDNAPTIDVVKAFNIIARGKSKDGMLLGIKTGHWIKTDNMLNIWKCSECNEEWCSEVGGNPLEYDYHYCPNCGAKMTEEAENDTSVL